LQLAKVFEHLSIENDYLKNIFQINLDDLSQVLKIALKRGAEFSELYFEYKVNTRSSLSENEIKDLSTGLSSGFGIRAISGDKTAYSFSDEVNLSSLKELAETVSYVSDLKVNETKTINFTKNSYDMVLTNTDYSSFYASSDKIALLKNGNNYARNLSSKIEQANLALQDTLKFIVIVNSNGLYIEDRQSIYGFSASVSIHDKGKRDHGHAFFGGRTAFSDLTETVVQTKIERSFDMASVNITAKAVKAGEQTVIMNKGWGGVLVHEAVGHGLEGDFIRKKTSLYTGKLNEKVASDKVTIVDNGRIDDLRGSINIDDEGNAAKKNVLIENGMLKGYLYDSLNAKLVGVESTGSGRRESFKSIPLPRMTNTYIDQGHDDPEEMIKDVKDGFFAKSLGGGQVDITNGNFVFEVSEAYKIENGKLTYPVKNATLIGNGPDIMTKVDAVGNDLEIENGAGICGKDGQSVIVGVGQPTVRITKMTVGGSEIN
jgi:TldD protein